MTAAPIDLRSDTVTKPSPAMRRAMADAEVGDDVLDGDPTTRRLEERIAELLGTEDALFFPSGTQANQTGIGLLAEHGTELLVEANAHLVHYELAGVAALSGVQIRPIATADGLLTPELVRGALRPASPGVPPARLARGAETVMVSVSKGLGCPVGSCLGLKKDRRPRGWEIRKRLGGGMRQSGVLAAADAVILRLARAGVRVVPFGPRRLRAVTHLDVSRADIERAARVIVETLR